MPEHEFREHDYLAGRVRRMKDAARDGQVLRVRCNLCRRTVYFLASDLVAVVGANHPVRMPPAICSKCGTTDYMDVKLRVPSAGDYGHLPIRRPAGIKKVQLWKTVRLGDDV